MKTIETKLKYLAKTGGIKTEATGDVWINPSDSAKENILNNMDKIKSWINKNVILELENDKTFLGLGLSETETESEEKGGSSDLSKFIVNISGKQFITMAGLLDVAHNKGLESIETDLIISDFEKQTFVFKAKVKIKGRLFESYGDASPSNVGSLVKLHIIRMAETRAIARALRWSTNIGMCSLEELGDVKDGN